jgi:hypothetical protein
MFSIVSSSVKNIQEGIKVAFPSLGQHLDGSGRIFGKLADKPDVVEVT